MKKVTIIAVGLMLLLSTAAIIAEDSPAVQPADATEAKEATAKKSQESDRIVVYYLHMNRRCMTCGKLESYSQEAILSGFPEQLKDSSVIWQVENFEQKGNEHFAKDYQLYSQSLILSRQNGGRETEWKNLDKIWQLVGNKEKFIAYVQMEVQKFKNHEEEE
ncbi:MAG: nitrophenyl compound nitroreductase subunit ArsF family protein [Candidatus Zixiibacteriota bacterium]